MRNIGPARLALLAAAMALGAFLGSAAPVRGASFTVNATYDAVDAAPGDGVCADATGACTLRAAVMETNALPGADEITLPAGTYVLSIPGAGEDASATGDLDVTDDLTVTGAGRDTTVIDGGGLDRVIHVKGSIASSLNDMTVANGIAGGSSTADACNSGSDPTNPGFANGGGVCSDGATLDATRVTLRNNSAGVGGSAIHSVGQLRLRQGIVTGNSSGGGAIFNGRIATIEGSLIAENSQAVIGGGIRNDSNATLVIKDSTVRGNRALDSGGGIFNGGNVTISATTIADNTAGQSGGGVFNSAFSAVELVDSNVSGNTARFGAGIYNNPAPQVSPPYRGVRADITGVAISIRLVLTETDAGDGKAATADRDVGGGSISIVSSAIVDNFARDDGGGISNAGDITFTNSTVSSNGASLTGSGILNSSGGTLTSINSTVASNNPPSGVHNFGTAQMKNTIIGSNKGADCVVPAAVTSLGHNLDSDGTCMLSGPGDLPNRDPRIGPLEFTTGPTFWHPLLGDSPAIDAGDANGCPATDQRGTTRPLDGNGDGTPVCDIGSYEIFQEIAPTPTPGLSVTPVQPIGLPETGGTRGQGGQLLLLGVMATLSALAGAAALSWRVLRQR